jgi:hypothetical protein
VLRVSGAEPNIGFQRAPASCQWLQIILAGSLESGE